MLNIYYGDMPEAIFNTSVYFNNTYYDSWLEDEFARKMIKSVDKAPLFINEPWLIDKYLFDYSDRIKEPENTEYL